MNTFNPYQNFGISQDVYRFVKKIEKQCAENFDNLDTIEELNQCRIIEAMQKHRLSDMHFNWNTGYGYNDAGRDVTEAIFAEAFGAEDAIVRPLIVNGTHALTLCLQGVLMPKDEMISIAGKPYDTLENVIGIKDDYGCSLKQYGIEYNQIELLEDGKFHIEAICAAIQDKTKMIYIQRSSGYSWRQAITIDDIAKVIEKIKEIKSDVVVMVDNCYGEFIDTKEPTHVGAELMAGSLIKNPGGGLALSGGYIVGRKDLIERISWRMTSPGIGKECGLTFGQTRSILQGFFLAPTVVAAALKNAILCSAVYKELGYSVCPEPIGKRSDIIQAIELKTPEAVIAFCQAIQSAAPVDSYVTPVPWDMPGYSEQVIMAAGAFVQGSSIELSADAPIKEPYIAYFQGGLTHAHGKLGILRTVQKLVEMNFVTLK